MNVYTSSPFSFLNMQTKTDFIVEPYKLLEITSISVINVKSYIDKIRDLAVELFVRPERGAYKKNEFVPFILPNEELYTHADTYEFFPEVSQKIFTYKTRKHPTVGKKITWQQAFEEEINVYNKNGKLLLKKNSNRNNFVFSPNAEIYSLKFVIEYIRYIVLLNTSWGDQDVVLYDIKKILNDEGDLPYLMKVGDHLLKELVEVVREIVRKNPWLIYSTSHFNEQLIIESSCDWRHYNCNKVLWDQQNIELTAEDPLFAYSYQHKNPQINYCDLENLYSLIASKTNIKVNDISELFTLLETSKNNKQLTENLLGCVKTISGTFRY